MTTKDRIPNTYQSLHKRAKFPNGVFKDDPSGLVAASSEDKGTESNAAPMNGATF